MVNSGAGSDGTHGIQIWLAHWLAHLISATVPKSSRLLAVTLETLPRPLVIIAGHAPSASSAEASKPAFWDDLDALFLSTFSVEFAAGRNPVFVGLFDFNAHLGSVVSEAVGNDLPVPECSNGTRARLWMESHRV
jgi:hypothetical protein